MNIVITTIGARIFAEDGYFSTVAKCRVGSAYNYTPTKDDTGLLGDTVFEADVIGQQVTFDTVLYKLSGAGKEGAQYGEVGLFDKDDRLLVLAVPDQSTTQRGSFNMDLYVTADGGWIDTMKKKFPVAPSINVLPAAIKAESNVYIVKGGAHSDSMLAFTDDSGMWSYDGFKPFLGTHIVSIPSGGAVRIEKMSINVFPEKFAVGEMLMQIHGGETRFVKEVVQEKDTVLLKLETPLNSGGRNPNAAVFLYIGNAAIAKMRMPKEYTLPIASSNVVGGIMIGNGLKIDTDGRVHAVPKAIEAIHVKNVIGAAIVAQTGDYNDLKNKPNIPKLDKFVLQAATPTMLGGVRVGKGLDIDAEGTLNLIGATVDPQSVVTAQSHSHFIPDGFQSNRPVWVLPVMYPLSFTQTDIIAKMDRAFYTDMTLLIQAGADVVGNIVFKANNVRGEVTLHNPVTLNVGQWLRFNVQTADTRQQEAGWSAGYGMALAVRSTQLT